jgi:hypothetical protein
MYFTQVNVRVSNEKRNKLNYDTNAIEATALDSSVKAFDRLLSVPHLNSIRTFDLLLQL